MLSRALSLLAFLRRSWPVLLPVVLLGIMLTVNPALRKAVTWDRIARNWAGVAILALGLTPIVITGGIDLSVGSVVGLAAVVAGFLWRLGCPVEIALLGAVVAGFFCGFINAVLVLADINPLVVTIATLAVFRGLAYGLSGAESVDDFPESLTDFWEGSFLGIPYPGWLVVAVFAIGYLLLHHTWMGRMLYASGDNERAAVYAGVPVRGLKLAIYSGSGLLAGLAGVLSVMQFRSAPANTGEGLELRVVACVVLGGIRITGGAGHLGGTLLGTLTLAALLEGLVSVSGQWRPLATGLFLLLVALGNRVKR